MFFYTIMNIFITLLENVNKSRTSAGSLSLTNRLYENAAIHFIGEKDGRRLQLRKKWVQVPKSYLSGIAHTVMVCNTEPTPTHDV
jgi:hypothetical protein